MLPITFPQQNKVYSKPSSMNDEQCFSLPVFRGKDKNGFPVIISKWMPSKEDIEAINRGEGIYLQIVSNELPPACLYTESPFTINENDGN